MHFRLLSTPLASSRLMSPICSSAKQGHHSAQTMPTRYITTRPALDASDIKATRELQVISSRHLLKASCALRKQKPSKSLRHAHATLTQHSKTSPAVALLMARLFRRESRCRSLTAATSSRSSRRAYPEHNTHTRIHTTYTNKVRCE